VLHLTSALTKSIRWELNVIWITVVVVVANVREILAVGKKAAPSFDRERFNLKKLNELQFRKQNQIEITNKYAALEI
jgi:hypothetical protein